MGWWAWVSLVGLWALATWQAWRGFRLGKVLSRYGDADRRENPISYWVLFPFYILSAALLGLLLILMFPGSR